MKRIRWEYFIVSDKASLDAAGREGWELVGVTVLEGAERFYLKRPAPSLKEEMTLMQRESVIGAEEDGNG